MAKRKSKAAKATVEATTPTPAKVTAAEPDKPRRGRPPRPPATGVRGRLGERLKALRVAKGMKGEELADATALAKSLIYNYEAGHHAANVDNLEKIVGVLGVTLAELFKGV